jgi:N-acetylglucosaminyldiphosphoundecaprenol N-acetyl-beta-D-mannosaminyltransferase
MNKVHVWGIKIHITTLQRVIELIDNNITNNKSKNCIHITGVNAETIADIYSNSFNSKAINKSDIVIIDGFPVLIALRLYGYNVPSRITCPDLFEALMIKANNEKQSVFFFGAEETVITNLVSNVKNEYPNIIICGYQNGYDYDEEQLVYEISELSPTYLFLGVPSYIRDAFLMKNKDKLNVNLCLGIGGMFDVLGGKVKRAPKGFQSIGLESLYRIIQVPSNYGKRFVKKFPLFIIMFFKGFFNNYLEDDINFNNIES